MTRPDVPGSATAAQAPDPLAILRHWSVATPDAIAVISSSGHLTFSELYSEVRRLASGIRQLIDADRPTVVVRSASGMRQWAMALAVRAAHGTCVPIDTDVPPARFNAIVESAEPGLIIADSSDDVTSAAAVTVDRGMLLKLANNPEDLEDPTTLDSEHPVSILYSSGSTGTPKGIRIPARSLRVFHDWAWRQYALFDGDVFFSHASAMFDMSTLTTYLALFSGRPIVLLNDDERRDVGRLWKLVTEAGVTFWYSVPFVLRQLVQVTPPTDPFWAGLRYVLYAGEAYPVSGIRDLSRRLDAGTVIHNLYGPTETNVCTFHEVDRLRLDDVDRVPIGRPLPWAHVVVDEERGDELCVHGDGVTFGYVGLPEAALSAGHPRRTHCTGDIVEWIDGDLYLRGRIDRSLKVNGFRVEPGEIEAVANQHPAVRDSIVLSQVRRSGTELVLVVEGGTDADEGDIRRHLQARLSLFMVPRRIVILSELPRNDRQKVDAEAARTLVFSEAATCRG